MASCPFKKRLTNGHAFRRQKKSFDCVLLKVLRCTFGSLFDSRQLIEVSNFLELLFSQYEHLSN